MATVTKKRVRVRRTRIALHGGRPALADFQLTPPFGNSIIRDGTGIRMNKQLKIGVDGGEGDFQGPCKPAVREGKEVVDGIH
ncbi:hypothetical protein F1880_010074 [Penicillium rolfsii]|nr:hypothetical protein F1880_010074 [Penicillium rolfsii]